MGGLCAFTRESAALVTTVNLRVYNEHTQSAMRHIRCASKMSFPGNTHE